MDEIEGYLQHFEDGMPRTITRMVILSFIKRFPGTENMHFILLQEALSSKKLKMVHEILDNNVDKKAIAMLPQINQIILQRERVRLCAIIAIRALQKTYEKDVGRIIGRAIWASRGIKEWTN